MHGCESLAPASHGGGAAGSGAAPGAGEMRELRRWCTARAAGAAACSSSSMQQGRRARTHLNSSLRRQAGRVSFTVCVQNIVWLQFISLVTSSFRCWLRQADNTPTYTLQTLTNNSP